MKILKNTCLIMATAVAGLTSCKNESDKDKSVAEVPGIQVKHMDTTINPKTDFYDYVNGNWMKTTEIPAEESTWGGFSILRKETRDDVLAILDSAQQNNTYAAGTDQAKALNIFESQLDTVARNEAGTKPLQPALDELAQVQNLEDLQLVLANNMALQAPFYGFSVFSNLSNSTMNAGYIGTGGLGLPNRDYYLDQDSKSKEIRGQYVDHITRMLQYLGDDEASAKKQANLILELETQLAKPRLDKVQRRDTRNFNNPRSVDELQKMVPAINWKSYISDLGITKNVDTLIVTEPAYMKELQKILKNTSIEDLKTLTRWSTFNNAASYLTTELETANWDFYEKTLNGVQKQKPADERALATVDNAVGEAVGKLYVDEKFPAEAKGKAEKMIANIKDAFKDRIENLEWMTDSTKVKAIEKLNKFTVKIGYPDKWENYASLDVDADKSFFENMIAVSKWNREDNLSDYGEPVDKSKWGMSPQTVNAYFNPSFNEIVFPAAILQPPFYNYQADEAVNYGGIGAVIGHEISHAFDDSGARFDGDGNLKNWWSDKDLENFTARGDALAQQYSDIEVADSLYINGKFTLGENIGDLGGVLASYDGLQKFYTENGKPDNIDGFTPEQRFFISWATIWRTKMRDDALRTRIKTDPHSPGMYRAYVPLQNVDAFYEAFNIKKGDSMFVPQEERVRIW
ncbi:M13 family metallopeptidase [Flavimarina sp. Hel_I_48]|uniref:M13 family metallopeptidase n=1 Tax=Flavimarina sp. Hel_I_48 TaxID=1392488 RepID=UPI0004DEE6DC|nr:M13 family metallopeptidase [Flavimarina sp. Hel_I_48]